MNVSIQEILTQAIGFAILVFVLKKLFWKPFLDSLENRREHIRKELAHIDSSKLAIEKMKSEYAAHLQKIEDEARVKIQDAVNEGTRIAKEIQDKARAEAQASFEKSKENLDLEISKARLSLRREIANLAIGTSEKILNEKMSSDQAQQAKALEIIEGLEKAL